MKTIAISLEDEQFEKLQDMVKSKDAANISHAVRKCINAYPFARKSTLGGKVKVSN